MHWEPVPPGRNSLQTTKAIPEPISLKLAAVTDRAQNSPVTTAVMDGAQDSLVTAAVMDRAQNSLVAAAVMDRAQDSLVTDRGRQVAEDTETAGAATLEADTGEGEIDSVNGFSYDFDLLCEPGFL
ncbi:hypothetical protein NSB25_23100 [Acetatifactor muris]|uniref:Uncharacterized protein n=1 Tax=Acetatifactor muris TaxID=879566 RepID=A0A2K4ZN33_9FIRM|nr:hypothetical protein [Acetatifactor muris]MCR2050141.1 hypothetical protein [Acetatifactor muris]SOY31802.1 hypothetical protein AMURIS_04550 [Acetatifactor muris]